MDADCKRCVKCGETKSLSHFYLHRTNKDGRQAYCKQCTTAFRALHSYPPTAEQRRTARQRYKVANREKFLARKAIGDLVRAGRLTKQPCEICGKSPAEAHHDDYKKRLDIRWLCRPHHMEFHKQQKLAA